MNPSTLIQALRGDTSPLRPGPRVLPAQTVADVHRARLVAGMAEAAAAKGYTATTITDVVARAQVSRRTFYEHFADKEACFLAAYDAASDIVIAMIAHAVADQQLPWQQRVAAGVDAYLRALAAEPALTHVFLIEILAAGPAALQRRRAVHERFAGLVRELADRHRAELPSGYAIEPEMANAIIGAVDELVLLAVQDGRAHDLPRIARIANTLVLAVLAPVPSPGG